MTASGRPDGTVVVWGNCQAEPIAALLAGALADRAGERELRVEPTMPVYLADEREVARVGALVERADFLISQPIGDDYRVPGSSTRALAARLPAGGRLITLPVTFHIGPFPYQVNAHGGDGARVNAPITDYHDLRAIVAAERGMDVDGTLGWWPAPDPGAVRTIAAGSLAELRRREATLDVATSHLLERPDAMMTISHPSNAVLVDIAAAVLAAMGVPTRPAAPEREFLGARRAPREAAVLHALGWPATEATTRWTVDGADVDPAHLVGAHLDFYRRRPDIVRDARVRYADRLALLGL